MRNCAPQQPCKPIESKCVLYSGVYLDNLNVFAGTNLDIILKKINDQISGGSSSLTLVGDVLAMGTLGSPITATLNSSGVIAGTYGSSSVIPVFSVDYKGRITNVSPVPLTYTETDPVFTAQKGQVLGVATLDSNGLVPLSQLPPLGTGTVTSVALTSGDITISGSPITTAGIITLTLPNIVSPNTFNNIQFNAKGQVIGGSNVAYLTVETDPVYLSQKGQPNGAATLTSAGKLTATQFPNVQDTSSVDLTFNTATNTLSADVLGYNPTNWNTAYNRSPVGLSFNIANGDLTLTKQDGTNIVENLDFRYILQSEAANFIQNQSLVAQNADFWIDGNGRVDGNFEVNSTTTLNDVIVEGNGTILSTLTFGSPAKGTISSDANSMDFVSGVGFDAQFGSGGRNNDITIANATGIVTFTQTPRVNANTMWHNGNFPLSISSPTNGQYLTYNGTAWVNTTTSFITSLAHNHFIANNAGTNQFSFGVNEAVRVVGAGDTTVSFNAGTKTITITSIPGSGGGGAVTSFNGRTGGVVSVEGDYNLTSLGDVTVTAPATNQLLQYNGSEWVNITPAYISGNQTITLSSDITGSGTTSIAATIANNAVTYAKMQDVTAVRLLGRYSATNGDPQEIQVGTGMTLNTATGVLSATGTGGTVTSVGLSAPSIFSVTGSPVTTSGTLSLALAVQSANTVFAGRPDAGAAIAPTFRALVSADIPVLDTSKITTGTFPIARGGTGLSTLGTANQLIRVNAGATALEYFTSTYLTGNQTITLSGDVSGSGATAITTIIGNGVVSYAKIQPVTTSRLLGRFSAGTGDTQEIQIGSGLTLNSGTGVLSATGSGGTVTSVGIASTDLSVAGSPITTAGNITLNVNNNAITYAKMQDITGSRLLGRFAASTGDPQEIIIGAGLSLNPTTGNLINDDPDQTVVLTPGTGIGIAGTYPNFTITNTAPNTVPTLDAVLAVGNDAINSDIDLIGDNRAIGWWSGANRRFLFRKEAEPTANFGFYKYDDVGTPALTATITRTTGVWNFLQIPTIGGTPVWYASNHPAGGPANNATFTGASVPALIASNSAGHITSVTSRTLTPTDIGAAPATGSGNYIQNTASLQASSNFYISGIGRTDGSFQVRKDGSATYSATFYLANTANSRAVNFQLNEDANPGLSTWIHNGTANIKRAEQFANDGRLSIYADNGEGINLVRAVSTVTNSTAGIRFNALNASSAPVSYAQIWGIIESNTAGSENGSLAFNTRMGGSVTEKMRLGFDGLLSKIGTLGNINLAASGAELAFTRSGANFIRATGAAGYINIVTGGAGLTDAESAITIAASNAVTIRGAVVTSSTVSVGSLPASASGGSFVVANANVLNSRTPTQVAAELATLLPTTGTTNYIQNQNTGVQTGNFNISGNGTVGGTLLATTAGGSGSVVSRSTSTGDALFTADVSGVSSTVIRTFRTGGRTGIFNNANEAISIITNGNVGIGGANPAYKLHTVSSGASVIMAQNSTAPSATSGAFLHGFATGTPSAANHRLGGVSFGANTTGSTYATGIQVEAWSEGAWTSGVSHPSYLRFMTTATGENTLSERMRLTAAGRLGVNTDTPATTLHVSGIVTGSAFYSETGSDLPIWAQNGNTMTFAVGTSVPKMYLDDSGNLGVGITPLAARGSILQAEGNVWCTDAYILGSAAGSTPIGEFGLDGNVFVRTMGTQDINFRTNASTTRMSIVHSTGNVVFEGQVQIKGGVPGAGKVLTSDGTGLATWQTPSSPGTGTVTSVALSLPSIFSVSGSPVTTSGTLTGTLVSQAASTVFAAPVGSGTPTFRLLVAADIPTLTAAKISDFTAAARATISAGTGISYSSATGVITNTGAPASGSANYIQNQIASAQSSSNFWISGSGISNTSFQTRVNGSNTFTGAISMLNAAANRGVSFQLNADANSGWATWIHNGTTWVKRFELTAAGVATLTGSLTAFGSITASQDAGVGAGRTNISFTTGGGFIQGEGHNGTTWVSGGLTYDATSHTLTGGDVIVNNDLQVDGTVTASTSLVIPTAGTFRLVDNAGSGKVLTSDGTGFGTWQTFTGGTGVITTFTTDQSNAAGGSDLYSTTIPAAYLNTNGSVVRASYSGEYSGTEVRLIGIKLNGTMIQTYSVVDTDAPSGDWGVEVVLIRVSNTTVRYKMQITMAHQINVDGNQSLLCGELTGLNLSASGLPISLFGGIVSSAAGVCTARFGFIEKV